MKQCREQRAAGENVVARPLFSWIRAMGWTALLLFSGLALSFPPSASSSAAEARDSVLVGSWGGKLELPSGISLRLVWNVTMGDGDSLQSTLPLVLHKGAREEPPKRPQEPKPPFPYRSREVRFPGPVPAETLAGTLTLPADFNGPVPAVLLVSGSGPENRDEEIFGHKPFLVLADDLTRRGVAVLRVDDRGVASSTGDFARATEKDFVEDALVSLRYLANRPEIDSKRVGLIGHSEGGLIGMRAASRSAGIAFLVLVGSPGTPGEQIIKRQNTLILQAQGVPDSTVLDQVNKLEGAFAVLRGKTDPDSAHAALVAYLRREANVEAMQGEERSRTEAAIQQQAQFMASPWFLGFLAFDPVSVLDHVRCPVLAVGGSKDLQVPAAENLHAIEAALRKGGNPDVTVRELEGLNHLLQPATTGAPLEYSKIETTIDPKALDLIGSWVAKQTLAEGRSGP